MNSGRNFTKLLNNKSWVWSISILFSSWFSRKWFFYRLQQQNQCVHIPKRKWIVKEKEREGEGENEKGKGERERERERVCVCRVNIYGKQGKTKEKTSFKNSSLESDNLIWNFDFLNVKMPIGKWNVKIVNCKNLYHGYFSINVEFIVLIWFDSLFVTSCYKCYIIKWQSLRLYL